MRTVLHILTRPDDRFADDLIDHQRNLPNLKVETADLSTSAPDYEHLLDQILAADSVVVW